jgi:hypothetical protein
MAIVCLTDIAGGTVGKRTWLLEEQYQVADGLTSFTRYYAFKERVNGEEATVLLFLCC